MARSPTLAERLSALDRVLELADGRLPPGDVEAARAVRAKASERLARGEDVVVAALAGGTGSGKSALFNSLSGEELAQVRARRPTTGEASAWAVGNGGATAVLDWLGVRHRHHRDAGPGRPDGLVLLDLPDHDSVVTDHRRVVDHLIERVDLMIWVLDPVKYAQRAVHADYLRRLAAHAEVLFVVLNKVDTLDGAERRACMDDLRRILALEGLAQARLVAVSARTGEGVSALRSALAEETRTRRAAAERIAADVRRVSGRLREDAGRPGRAGPSADGLTDALASAAGVTGLADLAGRDAAAQARRHTRPLLFRGLWTVGRPLGRALGALRGPRPRRAIELGPGGATPTGNDPSPVAVRHALLDLVDGAGADLPRSWRQHLRSLAHGLSQDVPRVVGRALDAVSLRTPRRRWWFVVALVWTLVEAVAVAGILWLALLALLAWLQLPVPDVPTITPRLPWPTALALGGAAAWGLIALLRNRLAAVGARRHRRRTLRRLQRAVAEAVERSIVAPIRAELDTHDEVVAALETASR